MELMDKDYTLDEVVELVNSLDCEFIINIKVGEDSDGECEGSV